MSNLRYVNSTLFKTNLGLPVVDIVILCDHQSGEAYAKSLDEVSEVFWISTQEILDDADLPVYLKENIKLAEKLLKGNWSYLQKGLRF